MTTHTAGPWIVAKRYKGQNPYETRIKSKNGSSINIGFSVKRNERNANARLIAAAPLMLETLKKLFAQFPVKELDEVIKKAEGRI